MSVSSCGNASHRRWLPKADGLLKTGLRVAFALRYGVVKLVDFLRLSFLRLLFEPSYLEVTKSWQQHEVDVAEVQRQCVAASSARHRITLLREDSDTHCTRKQLYKKGCAKIDISKLSSIIVVDDQRLLAVVEPLVTYESLYLALSRRGCRPRVCPEFKGITVGGTLAGGGLESTSFRFGLVEDNVTWFDVLLGDGRLVRCSRSVNKDLFFGYFWSLGTLGIVVAAEIAIQPTKPWVDLTLRPWPTSNLQELIQCDMARFATTTTTKSTTIVEDSPFCIPLADAMGASAPVCLSSVGLSDKGDRPTLLGGDGDPGGNVEYVEYVVLSPTWAVAIYGRSVTRPSHKQHSLEWYWAKWFVQIITEAFPSLVLENSNGIEVRPPSQIPIAPSIKTETAPAMDSSKIGDHLCSVRTDHYLFRWDRGVFWLGLRKMTPTVLKRVLFGWLFDMRAHHAISRHSENRVNEEKRILCDVGPPLEKVNDALAYCSRRLEVYPLWVMPVKLFRHPDKIFTVGGHRDGVDNCKSDLAYCIDLGIYGVPRNLSLLSDGRYIELNREIEDTVHQVWGGMKGFETACFYNSDEFKSHYDVKRYDLLRTKYKADKSFPSVFDKIQFRPE